MAESRRQNNQQKQDEKYHQMIETPVPGLICTLAVPTIISMLVTSIYNMADTFFVGRIGTSATAAVGVVFSMMAIFQAVGFTIGIGSGNYVSRLLGSLRRREAEEVACTGFATAFGAGLVLMIAGLLFLDPLMRVLGATPTILPYARAYAFYILLGAPFITSSFVLNNLLRFQGSAFYGMIGITAGGLLNIGLDPLFIFVFGMGTGGAALATTLSQIASFVILLFQSGRGGNIRIDLRRVRPTRALYREVLRGGLPSFCRQVLASIATICLNLAAGPYGDAAIAAMSIVSRVMMFAQSALIGFGQGFQPVCGFNYGARRYDRVRQAFWFCVKVSLVGLVVIAALGEGFAPQIIGLFRKGDAEVTAIGTLALRCQCAVFPLMGWTIMLNMLQQNIGKSRAASILAMGRQGLFFLPFILLLPHAIGMLGIQLSQPFSDLCTFALSVPMGIALLRELKEKDELEQARRARGESDVVDAAAVAAAVEAQSAGED
mgnify:CR=1 FL=1